MRNVLAIFSHPDDEVLGCGATLRKRVVAGDNVFLLLLSNGCGSRYSKNIENEVNKRIISCKKSSKILGIRILDIGNFKDNSFDSIDFLEIVKYIEQKSLDLEPKEIFTHFSNDLNIDHRITFQAVITAFRPYVTKNNLKIFQSEINSSTEHSLNNFNIFSPNHFENIDKTIDKKVAAMNCYKQELRKCPHSRSIKGIKTLASYRGMQASMNNAESFNIYFSRNL